MAFIGIEFAEGDGGGIAVVNRAWVTPRKTEVLWPPHKSQEQYYKTLRNGDIPNEETWRTYKIQRKFFEVDDYDKALKKIKEAEVTSDLQSDTEDANYKKKRRRCISRKLYDDSSEEEINAIQRPPPIKKPVVSQATFSAISDQQNQTYSRLSTPSSSGLSTPSSLNTRFFIEQDNSVDTPELGNKVLSLLQQIKEQNKQILHFINKQESSFTGSAILPDIPVTLPVKTSEELKILENFLLERENSSALSSYLSTLGGRDTTSLTNNILKRCITNELASFYSFCGKKTKKPFSELCLRSVVVCAVKKKNPQSSEKEIEDHIKVWLKHAPQRLNLERTRKNKQ